MIVPVAREGHHRAHLEPVLRLLPHRWTRERAEDIALVASYGDMHRTRDAGFGRIVLMQHGAGQSYRADVKRSRHPSYPGGDDNDAVSLFLVPNEYAAARWRQRYPRTPVEIVGCPILDDLPQKDPLEPRTVAISFHFDVLGSVPEMKSAWDHYRRVLPSLADRFNLIGHSHPRRRLQDVYERLGIEWVESFAEVCRRADLYVCDNSSTLYEFASTGRPVVVLNAPSYRREVSHGGRFWDWSSVGLQVDNPRDLADTIDVAMTDLPGQRIERERVLSLVYQPRANGAVRAATAIRYWLSVRAAA